MRFTHFWAAAAVAFVPVIKAQATDWAPLDPEAFEVKFGFDNIGRYIAPIGMGKPWSKAGNFSFLLSTSSPYTAVAAAGCDACVAEMGQAPVYNISNSSSAYPLGTTQNFSIGNGNMGGALILESCTFKKAQVTKWSYANQTVIMANSTAGILGTGVSGFVGFGRSTGNASYISGILNSSGWKNVTLGFAFNPFNPTATNATALQSAGSLTVRELNPDLFAGEIYWQPLTQVTGVPKHTPSDWAIKFDSYRLKFGSQRITSSGGIAIIEPYFQEVRIPSDEATEFFDRIPGTMMTNDSLSLSWVVPCDQELTLSITVGGSTYLMKKEQLISLDSTGTVCTSLVKGWSDPVVNAYMFGTPFTSMAYIAYNAYRNQSSDQIGLAPRSTGSTPDQAGSNQGVPSQGVPSQEVSDQEAPNQEASVSKMVLVGAVTGSILGTGFIVSAIFFAFYNSRRGSDTPGSHDGNPGVKDKFRIEPFPGGEPNSATPILPTTTRRRRYIIEQGPVGGEPSELVTHEQMGSLNSPQSSGSKKAMQSSDIIPVLIPVRESQLTDVSAGSPTSESSPHQEVRVAHSFYGAHIPSVPSIREPGRRRLSEPAPPPYPSARRETNTGTTAVVSTPVSPVRQNH